MKPVEFRHEAMATTFALFIADQAPEYARQAAGAAWRELDRLESELSRYVESSDIARANRLPRGGSLVLGDDALQCLLLAAGVTVATQRAFDPAYASEGVTVPPPYFLDPESHTLVSHADRLHLDLGAVGKGYALDRLAAVLREWEIPAACLDSGGSTALTLAPPSDSAGWSIGLGEGNARRILSLSHVALSGSGTAVKGPHLINPRDGQPARRPNRAWALAPSAALADALSTAFFVLSDDEITGFCAAHPEVGAATVDPEGNLRLAGTLAAIGGAES